MRLPHLAIRSLAVLLFLGHAASPVRAAEAGDHPLVGRYEGSELVGSHVSEFDEVDVVDAPIGNARGVGAPGWKHLEGRITLLYYRLPEGRSSLEVLRNWQASLEAKGFGGTYTCSTGNGTCYATRDGWSPDTSPYAFANALDSAPELPRLDSDFIRNYFGTNARYLLSRLARPEGAVYVSIALAEHARGNHAFVRVVETREMDAGMITFVGVDAMQKSLAETGSVSLYGIHFDVDEDVVRADSAPTLGEIAKLLRADADLSLTVVGHTDATGTAQHNLDLSQRRAANVATALVREHGIDAARLQPRGAGAGEPAASNDDEVGRAKNRRVELVKR
jgi:outer membrane protein OmpA-like peptidoglycan-associated protein